MKIKETFQLSLKNKQGRLSCIGMVVGLLITLVGSIFLKGSGISTGVTLLGTILSLACGNAYSQIITIIQQQLLNEEDNK